MRSTHAYVRRAGHDGSLLVMREIKSLKRQGGWAFLAPIIASIVGAIVQGQQNKNQAASAERWSAAQSGSAHQREVTDLRAAGLNPMLSGTGGQGATTTPGIPASVPDVLGGAVSSGLQAARLKQELQNMKESATNTHADTKLKSEQQELAREQRRKTSYEAEITAYGVPGAKNAAESETQLGPMHKQMRTLLETLGLGTRAIPNMKK